MTEDPTEPDRARHDKQIVEEIAKLAGLPLLDQMIRLGFGAPSLMEEQSTRYRILKHKSGLSGLEFSVIQQRAADYRRVCGGMAADNQDVIVSKMSHLFPEVLISTTETMAAKFIRANFMANR